MDRPTLAVGHFARFRAAVATPISLGRAGYWLGRALRGDRRRRGGAGRLRGRRRAPDELLRPARRGRGRPAARPAADRRAGDARTGSRRRSCAPAWCRPPTSCISPTTRRERRPSSGTPPRGSRPRCGRRWRRWRSTSTGRRSGCASPRTRRPKASCCRRNTIRCTPSPRPSGRCRPSSRWRSPGRSRSSTPRAGSHAGARGLMQLMPATARDMAEATGEPYELARLTADPLYNARLGTEYLARMLDYFDGAYVLATAAYNAGPGRVDDWLEANGDPRDPARRRRRLDRVDPLHRDPQLRDAGPRRAARLPRAARGRAGAGADRRRHRRRAARCTSRPATSPAAAEPPAE